VFAKAGFMFFSLSIPPERAKEIPLQRGREFFFLFYGFLGFHFIKVELLLYIKW